MNVLIDASVKGCNVALFDDKNILASVQEPIERGHAAAILPLFQSLMSKINKIPQDIDNVYIIVGPGSFTGLRVGLTTAQFMGFSLNKPVHGITSFQAFSCGVESVKNRMILVETKRTDFYTQLMNANHEPIGEPSVLTADQMNIPSDVMVTGDAVDRFINETKYDGDVFQQDMIDIPNIVKAIQSNALTYQKPEAFYIREADVSKPKASTR